MINKTINTLAVGLLLTTATLFSQTADAAVEVSDIRLWAGPERTRVVLDLSGLGEYTVFPLKNPDRIVVDMKRAKLASVVSQLPVGGLVKEIRTGPRGGDDLRVVIDLSEAAKPNTFTLKPNELYGHRLVVDLNRAMVAAPQPAAPVQLPTAPSQPVSVPAPRKNRNVVVAIDAGHGGEDPGAIGPSGAKEKDVVLQVSRQLEALIRDQAGMDPVMIRTGDYYVGLKRRMELARQANADIFVSIHANSFRSAAAKGSAVYVLSRRGATSESARWLADRENASDLVGGVIVKDKDDVLASVLLDLSQAATMEASVDVGGQILNQISTVNRLHKRQVQKANFVVLRAPDVPSILVETAFISNPKEERQLKSRRFQRKLSAAILNGVKTYFTANPPPGTYFADLGGSQRSRDHVIQSGDTLSGIAKRYGITLKRLQAANPKQASKPLHVGQILTIPSGS